MTEISRRGATGVGVASLVAAAAGYLALILAGQALPTGQDADFIAFWGLLFFFFGTLGGLQNEATRSVHVSANRDSTTPVSPDAVGGPPLLALALLVGVALAAVVAGTALLWAPSVLGARPGESVAVVALAVVAFSGHSAVAGTLAGRGRWTAYATLVGAEAVVRLTLVVLVALAAADADLPLALQAATGGAALTWLLLWLLPRVRGAAAQPAGPPRLFLSAAAHAMVGTASSAALVVGFPVLVKVTTDPGAFEHAAPLLYAVLLTRAPLLIPLNAYQSVAITYFLDRRGAGPVLRLGGLVLGVGALGAVAAALVGPWLMVVLLGEGSRVEPLVLGLLTLAAAVLGLLTLSGAATLALGGHRAYAAGWLVATACSAVLLLVPGELEARVVTSLAVGPLAGVAVHALWFRGALRGQR
ncbi:MAG: hypothetical protein JWP95_1739 [Actinotalea sp.]|nr:hypothetical protein [Actinotalea sp.]